MNKSKINDIADLQQEILRLKNLKKEQESYLNDQYNLLQYKIAKPYRFVENLFSFLPGGSRTNASVTHTGEGDWLTKALRVGLPFLVNRIFFRKAGYFKRIVMGLISSQAAGLLNKDRLAQVVNKITAFIKPSKADKKVKVRRNQKEYNFGIPPDSETY